LKCRNPWKKCGNTDIVVFIRVNDENLPICRECWNEIADSDKEWGEDKKVRKTDTKKKKANNGFSWFSSCNK